MAGASAASGGVPAVGVSDTQPAHAIGEFAIVLGPQHQMPVVWHQTIGQKACTAALHRLPQQFLKSRIFGLALEDRHACIGSVEDMVNLTADVGSGWPGHSGRMTTRPECQ